MYTLSVFGRNRRVGTLTISIEFGGRMKEVNWKWNGIGMKSEGQGGWEESEYGTGYYLTLIDDNGHFAYLNSKLWEKAKPNKNTGHPPLPWFPRKSSLKGTMLLLASFNLPTLEWDLV